MFRHPNPLGLINKKTVGNHECAALAQNLVPGLIDRPVNDWSPGAKVKGRPLPMGTVIAIFDRHGVYLGQHGHDYSHGKAHTALYVRQTSEGIEVVHQHEGNPLIKGTLVRFGGVRRLRPGGNPKNPADFYNSGVSKVNIHHQGMTPEDDANNYYVVKLKPNLKPVQKPDAEPVQKLDHNQDFQVEVTNSTIRSK
jgi:hypothetical protein